MQITPRERLLHYAELLQGTLFGLLEAETLELLLHLSDDSHANRFPTEREGAALHALGCAVERERGCLKPSSLRRFAR
jgi:hypothetical protein